MRRALDDGRGDCLDRRRFQRQAPALGAQALAPVEFEAELRTPANHWGEALEREVDVTRTLSVALFVAALIAVIICVDLLFFRNRLWERLMVNVGIVLVFAAFYLRFLKIP